MSVTAEARAEFRLAVAVITGHARRTVGVSEAMIAMATLAQRHADEMVEIMKKGEEE
jgi:hypothetical protein